MTPPVVIDARPRGPHGALLAGETVLGRPILLHLVDLAAPGGETVTVYARENDFERLESLASAALVRFAVGPPPEGAAILRSDRIYDAKKLRRALDQGRDPESAVAWRLDQPWSLAAAHDELTRRQSYQPLGRYWALMPAKWLAHTLTPTAVRPNAVTLVAAVIFFAATAVVGFGPNTIAAHLGVAVALALALVLDTADGHLARLQGTASEFGRWLDAVLDEAADFALHAAVAWSLYATTHAVVWLVLGWGYMVGKYLFVIAQSGGPTSEISDQEIQTLSRPSALRAMLHLTGHADIRWHLWIVLAALGRLDVALMAYSAYFPLRTLLIGVKKGVRRG